MRKRDIFLIVCAAIGIIITFQQEGSILIDPGFKEDIITTRSSTSVSELAKHAVLDVHEYMEDL
jgi:hypothetical protein